MIVRSFVNTDVLRSCLAQFAFFVFILKIFPMVQSFLAENNLTDRRLADRHLTDRRLADRRLARCFVNSAVTLSFGQKSIDRLFSFYTMRVDKMAVGQMVFGEKTRNLSKCAMKLFCIQIL